MDQNRWLSKRQIRAIFGVSRALLDDDIRHRLPDGSEKQEKGKELLIDGKAVFELRLRQALDQYARGAGATEASLREQKLGKEIERLEGQIQLLHRDIQERDRERVPTRELKVLFGTLGQITRSTCLQAEKQFGVEGRELFEEMWRAFERNFRRLTGELDDGVALCKRHGRTWKPIEMTT